MKLANLVLSGSVTDLSVRSGSNDRGPWRIVTAFLVGPREAYEVTLPDELAETIDVGDDVELVVNARVYRERVTFTAIERFNDPVRAA